MAVSQLQAAYAAIVHSTKNKWNYECRTVANCAKLCIMNKKKEQRDRVPCFVTLPSPVLAVFGASHNFNRMYCEFETPCTIPTYVDP